MRPQLTPIRILIQNILYYRLTPTRSIEVMADEIVSFEKLLAAKGQHADIIRYRWGRFLTVHILF